jgi:8-oxo-dGTP pyrophosphatase MutT (NUDIX family)
VIKLPPSAIAAGQITATNPSVKVAVSDSLKIRYDRFIAQAIQANFTLPDHDRWAFEIDDDVVGSIKPEDAQFFAQKIAGLNLEPNCLSLAPFCSPDAPSVLAQMASALRDQGRLGKWRNELLRVTGDSGQVRGLIERAAVRQLGIRTFAVHLVAYSQLANSAAITGMWVQQRALDKANDPGLWDTCAGGLAAGDESLLLSLEREVQEEAGLDLQHLQREGHQVKRGNTIQTRRNIPEGLLVEELLCWDIDLPTTVIPINQDGEVEQFQLWSIEKIIGGIADQQFTVEAALIIHQSLFNRGYLG